MEKNLKKVATYGINEHTPLCDVKTARERLKDCKKYIVDDAVNAFESMSLHTMTAVEYIKVECSRHVNMVTCAGYVWTSVRTADHYWFCYCVDAYTGNQKILFVDGKGKEQEYNL